MPVHGESVQTGVKIKIVFFPTVRVKHASIKIVHSRYRVKKIKIKSRFLRDSVHAGACS